MDSQYQEQGSGQGQDLPLRQPQYPQYQQYPQYPQYQQYPQIPRYPRPARLGWKYATIVLLSLSIVCWIVAIALQGAGVGLAVLAMLLIILSLIFVCLI